MNKYFAKAIIYLAMALSSDDRTLYIGNLDRNVSDDVLYELFLQAGPIERVSIPSNSNESFRYGFVTYKHEVSIDYAIQLYKGINLFKRTLQIKKKGKSISSTQSNNNKHGTLDNVEGHNRQNSDYGQFSLSQLHGSLIAYSNCNSELSFNSNNEFVEGNHFNRNKHYRHDSRKYPSRSHDLRTKYKGRSTGNNKPYHSRKKRY